VELMTREEYTLLFTDILPHGQGIYDDSDSTEDKITKLRLRLRELQLIEELVAQEPYQAAERHLLNEIAVIDRRGIWVALVTSDKAEIERLTFRRMGIVGVLTAFRNVKDEAQKVQELLASFSEVTPQNESEDSIDG
jgi:hypothetical protein